MAARCPAARLIDMKQELRAGNDLDLSRELEEGVRDAILDGKQSILFLNRRGNSRVSCVCMDCGDVPQCPRCSVHLTYHSAGRRLMCHYCGYSEPAHARCAKCGGAMKAVGSGTQKVEQELKALFPDTAVLRMDADTVAASGGHEAMLRRFRDEQIPILLGTQMVAKGLDFPSVTLVGVLDADMSLYVDNFRAAETTFSLITQVVGRSGRGADSGCAMIQTMTPEHPVLQLAARQDYDAFYDMELQMRKLRSCPPFSDLFTITVAGTGGARPHPGQRPPARRAGGESAARALLPGTGAAARPGPRAGRPRQLFLPLSADARVQKYRAHPPSARLCARGVLQRPAKQGPDRPDRYQFV